MPKIAFNSCYGGFSLSNAAVERYKALGGTLKTYDISGRDIDRACPILIQIIEELGDRANGFCADIALREIPSGAVYHIDEYDGNERVMLCGEYEWSITP